MKRLITLLISISLCLSMIPASVFADDGGDPGKICNLVVIGDSTSTGYGMPDHIRENNSFAIGNTDLEGSWKYEDAVAYNKDTSQKARGRMSNDGYPWLLKKYLESLDGVSRCDYGTLSIDALTSAGVRAMLDPAYYQREIAQEAEIMDSGSGIVNDQIEMYKEQFYDGGAISEQTYDALHTYAEDTIKKADVLVYDASMNNIALYMFRRLSGIVGASFLGGGEYYKERVSDLEDLTDKQRAALKVLREELEKAAGMTDNKQIDDAIETILYCYADCVINFTANIKLIRKLNPDAKIIVTSLYNGLAGFDFRIGDTGADLESMYQILVQAVNTYVKVIDENSPNYYIADVPMRLRIVNDEFKEAESIEEFMKTPEGQSYLNFLYVTFGKTFCPPGKEEEYADKIKTLYALSIRDYPIDILAFAGGLNMGNVVMEVQTYLQTEAMPSDGTMMFLHLMAGMLLLHPSRTGCAQKFEAIRDACGKDNSAYEEVLISVVDAVKAAASKAGINSIDDLKKIAALKDLTSLITKEDLLKIAMSVYELPDLEEEIRQYMDEHSGTSEAETKDRVATLEEQVKELTELIEKLTQEAEKKESTLAKAKIKKVNPAKKALTVKWKAVANASGYQVYYKTSGKKAVVKTVKGARKLALKLTGLKKKAKYTVKVRAYKTASGKTTYGKWSATKKAKTK